MKQWKGKLNDKYCCVKFLEEYGFMVNLEITTEGYGTIPEQVIAIVDEHSIWFSSMGVFYCGSYEKTDEEHSICGYSYVKDEKKTWKLILY